MTAKKATRLLDSPAFQRPIYCAIYLRISQDQRQDGLAVSRQRADCHARAKARGWLVYEEYVDESKSAYLRNVKRPAYDRMVADFAAGRFSAIVVYDLDRLTRQPAQLEEWITASEERGLTLLTVDENLDLTTTSGQLHARIKAGVARAEMMQKAARQRFAGAQRAEMGRLPVGRRLTGYTQKGDYHETEADMVRDIFARFLAGESLKGIARSLDEQGCTLRQAGERGGVASDTKWRSSTVHGLLTNPRYAGRVVYQGKVTGQLGTQWKPLVSEEIFDRAQMILDDPTRKTGRSGTDRKHLGSSLYICGVCGRLLQSHSGNCYRCQKNACMTRGRQHVDAYVLSVVMAYLSRPDLADLLVRPGDDKAAELNTEVQRLRLRLKAVEDDYDSGVIDGLRYSAARKKILAQLEEADKARARTVRVGLSELLSSDRSPAEVFAAASINVKRTIVNELFTITLLKAIHGKAWTEESVEIVPKF